MSKYKEILRYHITGLSQREIQKVTGISRPTISRVLTAFSKKSLKWEEVRELSEEEISSKLFEKMNDANSIIYEYPDYEQMTNELTKPGVTKKLLWQEYVEACLLSGKVPLQYSQFCDRFMKHLNTEKATMHLVTNLEKPLKLIGQEPLYLSSILIQGKSVKRIYLSQHCPLVRKVMLN